MYSGRTNNSIKACGATILLFGLGACASNPESVASGDDQDDASGPAVRCPAGYTMVCETKKTGRITFGTIGKEDLDSCACEPEYGSGRPPAHVIPH